LSVLVLVLVLVLVPVVTLRSPFVRFSALSLPRSFAWAYVRLRSLHLFSISY
jgi:hypothetical protein